jgi:uncharacterized protein YqhQ
VAPVFKQSRIHVAIVFKLHVFQEYIYVHATQVEIANFYQIKGNNSKNTKKYPHKNTQVTTTHAEQQSCKVS